MVIVKSNMYGRSLMQYMMFRRWPFFALHPVRQHFSPPPPPRPPQQQQQQRSIMTYFHCPKHHHDRLLSYASLYYNANMFRNRTFHSFIWKWLQKLLPITTTRTDNHSINDTSNHNDIDPRTHTTNSEKGEETIEERNYRYSMINAHPLGPWQAILTAVKRHYSNYNNNNHHHNYITETTTGDTVRENSRHNNYNILDVGCGPRGQPGTTIANALPHVSVHCIDSCPQAVHSIPTSTTAMTTTMNKNLVHSSVPTYKIDITTTTPILPPLPFMMTVKLPLPITTSPPSIQQSLFISSPIRPPSNLIKSVCNMDHLSKQFGSNSINVIVSCFGYGSSSNPDNIISALRQAYDTLVPGGILILCTWQYSSLLALTHDMTTTLQHGCGDSAAMIRLQNQDHIDDGTIRNDISSHGGGSSCHPKIQYSGTNEWEDLLYQAGFQIPNQIQSTLHTYPIQLGNTPQEQLNFGTLLIPLDVQEHYNGTCPNSNDYWLYNHTPTNPSTTTKTMLGYRNHTEEAFWMNVSEHTNGSTSPASTLDDINNDENDNFINKDTTLWMPKNIFKLTISTK